MAIFAAVKLLLFRSPTHGLLALRLMTDNLLGESVLRNHCQVLDDLVSILSGFWFAPDVWRTSDHFAWDHGLSTRSWKCAFDSMYGKGGYLHRWVNISVLLSNNSLFVPISSRYKCDQNLYFHTMPVQSVLRADLIHNPGTRYYPFVD